VLPFYGVDTNTDLHVYGLLFFMAFIEIRNLFKRFKNVVAVNHIDLDVNRGEILTLLGPSGCGKTTTLRCIAGLERPEEGDIRIDGKTMCNAIDSTGKQIHIMSAIGHTSLQCYTKKK